MEPVISRNPALGYRLHNPTDDPDVCLTACLTPGAWCLDGSFGVFRPQWRAFVCVCLCHSSPMLWPNISGQCKDAYTLWANFGGTCIGEPFAPTSNVVCILGKGGANGCNRYGHSPRLSVMNRLRSTWLITCGVRKAQFPRGTNRSCMHVLYTVGAARRNFMSLSFSRNFSTSPVTLCSRSERYFAYSNLPSFKPSLSSLKLEDSSFVS